MKPHHYRSGAVLSLAAPLLLGLLPSLAQAQSEILVPWNHSWNYMHPTGGVLPAGSGATEPNSGPTKWYASEDQFAASYAGPSFTTSGTGYQAGAGQGPLGYGAMDYFTNPLPPPAEFTALATTLTTPTTALRYTAYFRTTFTIPDDGNFYVNPVLRYILDDGGFVYIDGQLVLRVNMATAATDAYTTLAANTTRTESHIRSANLSLAVNSATGGNTLVTPALAGNATVIQRITSLAPGVHTLAISAHNQANSSSDLDLAVELSLTKTNLALAATASTFVRDLRSTPFDPSDDLMSFLLNVTPTGSPSASWTITGPAGSVAVGQSGPYSSDVLVGSIPIAEYATGSLSVTVGDTGTPAANATVIALPQRIIGTNDTITAGYPIITTGDIPSAGWVFDDTARNAIMNNGGGGSRKVIRSEVIDLTSIGAVQFSGDLRIDDTSSGTEAADSFVAYLIVDGNTASPINLILPHDTLVPDGVLSDDELAPAGGTFTRSMSHVIPAGANSVQIVLEGINDSNNEKFTLENLTLGAAPPTLQAVAGAVVFNNKGTDDPTDDEISAPVTIDAINLGASTGWSSTGVPANGLYSAPNPVTFGPYLASASPVSVTLSDSLLPAAQATVTLTSPARTFTVGAPTNIVRHENGPGLADDTVTFDVAIAGTNGGPGWTTTTAGVTPASGPFGTVSLTIAAPLPASPAAVAFTDRSYPASTATANVAIPGRYVIGQTNFGTAADLGTPIASPPSALWVNDAGLRTLTINAGVNAQTETVLSDVVDLSAVGDVQFSAKLTINDTSAGSNLDLPDKFKAELIIDGGLPSESIVSLVTPFDHGDGLSAVPFVAGVAVPNGPADGWINGYTGTASAIDGFAAAIDEYNAHLVRDEFNLAAQPAADSMSSVFNFSHLVPAAAASVQLRIQSQGINGTETGILSDILFALSTGPVDTDTDGMTDAYEDANGLNKNDAGDKFLDLDGDGSNNYAEYLAGTAANDHDSVFRITANALDSGTGNFSITWNSIPGKKYRIQTASTTAGPWTDATPDINASAGSTTTLSGTLPGPLPSRAFFQVRTVP